MRISRSATAAHYPARRAERGGYLATGHGNSAPRFHVTWGTGPAIIEPFVRRVREAHQRGLVTLKFRHRVDELTVTGGVVDGVRGEMLEPSSVARGRPSSRVAIGEFALGAQAVIVASGGIGANHSPTGSPGSRRPTASSTRPPGR